MNFDRPVNDVLEDAWQALNAKMEGLGAPYPIELALIEYDLARGRVRLRWESGDTRIASAQLVGVAQPDPAGPPEARIFRWGWDEASIGDGQREPAIRLRTLGQERAWEEMTMPLIRLHLLRIWGLCALGAEMIGAAGAVMARTQGREVYLTIGPLQAEAAG